MRPGVILESEGSLWHIYKRALFSYKNYERAMCIPIVTFNFSDTYEYSKNQLNSFSHSWDTADYIVPMTLKTATIFEHAHPITIKVTFSFLEYVLAWKKSATFIHSFRDYIPMPILEI